MHTRCYEPVTSAEAVLLDILQTVSQGRLFHTFFVCADPTSSTSLKTIIYLRMYKIKLYCWLSLIMSSWISARKRVHLCLKMREVPRSCFLLTIRIRSLYNFLLASGQARFLMSSRSPTSYNNLKVDPISCFCISMHSLREIIN
jgi:hypothetical protein